MTEKQLSFIKDLLKQKAFTQFDADGVAYDLELKSGKASGYVIDLERLEDIGTLGASALIDSLLKAPTKVQQEYRDARREAAFLKYERLIGWAKDNGLKVRARMKAATVRQIITAAGLEIPAELA